MAAALDAGRVWSEDFDVIVINLDRSPDRMAAIAEDLDRIELPYRRFSAVDGSKLDLASGEVRTAIDFDFWRKYHHRDIVPAEIGCFLSHVGALRMFLDGGRRFGVVLEDDAQLTDALPGVLRSLGETPDRWDLVKLFASHAGRQRRREHLSCGAELTSFVTQTGRATGYVVTREAAPALLKRLSPARLPYDHIFDRNFEHGLRVRGVMPMPINPRPVRSTIEVERTEKAWSLLPRKWGDPPLSQRWRVPFYRAWIEMRRLYHNLVVDAPRARPDGGR